MLKNCQCLNNYQELLMPNVCNTNALIFLSVNKLHIYRHANIHSHSQIHTLTHRYILLCCSGARLSAMLVLLSRIAIMTVKYIYCHVAEQRRCVRRLRSVDWTYGCVLRALVHVCVNNCRYYFICNQCNIGNGHNLNVAVN